MSSARAASPHGAEAPSGPASADPRARRTRRRVFDAVERLVMQEDGGRAEGIAVSDIVREAGISRSSFYAHFEDASAVASALLREDLVVADVAAATMKDRSMTIGVAVNQAAISSGEIESTTAPAGGHSAYRWTSSADGVETAHRRVLFGAWQPRAEGGVQSGRRGTASSAAAHAVAVTASADPARIDSLLDSIDFDVIAATLAR